MSKNKANKKEVLLEVSPCWSLLHFLPALTLPSTAVWLCSEHPTQRLLVMSAGMSRGHRLGSFSLLFMASSSAALLGCGSLCFPTSPPFPRRNTSLLCSELSVEVPWVAIISDNFLSFPKSTHWLSPSQGCAWKSPSWPSPQTPGRGTCLLTGFPLSGFTFFQSLLHIFPPRRKKLFQKQTHFLEYSQGFSWINKS